MDALTDHIFVFNRLGLPPSKDSGPEARVNHLTFMSIMEEGDRSVGLSLVQTA